MGNNKSKRNWKIGVNRKPNKFCATRGKNLTFQERKKRAEDMKQLRQRLRDFKQKKIQKRKEMKQIRKDKKRQRQLNQIKSGKFEIIKDAKKIKKWSKKMKQQLVKLPAEMFERVINK